VEYMMADQHPERDDDWAALSSMADGEAGAEVQGRCLDLWSNDPQARERWHDYQLIGDVMRSQELAHEAPHDAAFLRALHVRLAAEPPVLRPKASPAPVAASRSRAWGVPMAAMAGVAAVAGVVVVLRTAPEGGSLLAAQRNAAPTLAATVPATQPAPAVQVQAQAVNGRLIRDARLDRYFAAHRQSANGTALQMPGTVVRSVDTIVLEDR
jgi:sigma-E factor negative regulatory protein RseA